MSVTQSIERTDSFKVQREKINANFQLLQARRENVIAAINNSPESAKIALSRIEAITVNGGDVTNIPWANVLKTGSSLAHLATRSAGALDSGTLADGRLSNNVPLLSALNAFLNDLVFGAGKAITNGITINLLASSAGAKPGLRYLGTGTGTGKWQFSNDGSSWNDIGTPTGSGVTSFNGQTGSSQTFANDVNVTLNSSGNVHTLGWSGTLSVARGGTGSANAAAARAALGAAGLADQNLFTKMQNQAKGVDIASANTLTLGTDGNFFHITGSTQINSIGGLQAGTIVVLRFAGALTIQHSTNLKLTQAQNFITEADDVLILMSEGGGVWREISRIYGTTFRPTGKVNLNVFATSRLVLPVGANKYAT